MLENIPLFESIKTQAYDLGISKPQIPKYISDNLKHSFFVWQKEAFENLLTYQAIQKSKGNRGPTHLMLNMVTGTGKTLLMAAAILYYYKQGYRQFIFFETFA